MGGGTRWETNERPRDKAASGRRERRTGKNRADAGSAAARCGANTAARRRTVRRGRRRNKRSGSWDAAPASSVIGRPGAAASGRTRMMTSRQDGIEPPPPPRRHHPPERRRCGSVHHGSGRWFRRSVRGRLANGARPRIQRRGRNAAVCIRRDGLSCAMAVRRPHPSSTSPVSCEPLRPPATGGARRERASTGGARGCWAGTPTTGAASPSASAPDDFRGKSLDGLGGDVMGTGMRQASRLSG